MKTLEQFQKKITPYLKTIRDTCVHNRLTIAVAESVTAGAIQLLLSTAEDAQQFYQGGITAYNVGQKAIHLGIEPIYAEACNCVDDVIAIEMAKNVCKLFHSQIGIGITGYATKVPELGIDKLFANIAIVKYGDLIYSATYEPTEEKIDAQVEYAGYVIEQLAKSLL